MDDILPPWKKRYGFQVFQALVTLSSKVMPAAVVVGVAIIMDVERPKKL